MSISASSVFRNSEILSSKIVTTRFLCFFKRKRLEIQTVDGDIYSVAIRTINKKKPSETPKRFFAVNHKKKTLLINKKSLKKRIGISNKLVEQIQSQNPQCTLDTLLCVNKNLSPLVNALLPTNDNYTNCQETAFKIAMFIEEEKKNLMSSTKDFHVKMMDDGRRIIAYKDASNKFNFLVDVCFKNGRSKSIGSGGYKQVYSYYNFQKQKENVAVSIQTVTREKDIKSARKELKFYKKCQDIPQILQPKASFETVDRSADKITGEIITVMKKYDGDINDCLSRCSEEDNRKIFRKIVQGVAEMHKLGIVHRDLKFQNVLYRVNKVNEVSIKIIDLGLACRTDDKKELSYKAGTSYYMPPEVIGCSTKHEPEKIDSWALGIMLYKICYKERVPFSKKISEILRDKSHSRDKHKKVLTEEAQKLIQSLKKKNDPWADLIAALIQPEPKNRMSAEDAADEVDRLLGL